MKQDKQCQVVDSVHSRTMVTDFLVLVMKGEETRISSLMSKQAKFRTLHTFQVIYTIAPQDMYSLYCIKLK